MAFSSDDIQIILQYFMEQLPEDKLAELDARIDGTASESPAMDAALAKKGQWLALDSHTRQAVRESRQTETPFHKALASRLTRIMAAASTKKASAEDGVASWSRASLRQRLIQLNVRSITHRLG